MVTIRDEKPEDAGAIRTLVRDAFLVAEHSSGTEARIVDALREARALTMSLVAIPCEDIAGYLAISPVKLGDAQGWQGLGPVAVSPANQQQGVGTALISHALTRLRMMGVPGCVVLGNPNYYARFGFLPDPNISYPDVPPSYFQVIDFYGRRPQGEVEYHKAFGAARQ